MSIRIVALVSGKFSDKGNYTAKTITGERFFVSAAAMEKLGFDKESESIPTLWAAVTTSTYNVMVENSEGKQVPKVDAEGKPETFQRDEATAVFATKAELIAARNAGTLLELEADAELRKEATALGLKEETVDAILTNSAI